MLSYRALATDYDGTIAHDGKVDDDTLAALRQARAAGLVIVLITGRQLPDLLDIFAHPNVFDRIVAENGAVVFDPSTQAIEVLGAPPPRLFIDELQQAQVPFSVGHSIVATVRPHEAQMRNAIQALTLPWHIVLNKDAVMALPVGVDKAVALRWALNALGVRLEETVGVGDAENDATFLAACGMSVAVDNALPEIKTAVNLVTSGARGAGVRELITKLLSATDD